MVKAMSYTVRRSTRLAEGSSLANLCSKTAVVTPLVPDGSELPLPFRTGTNCSCSLNVVASVLRRSCRNELHWRPDAETRKGLLSIWGVMKALCRAWMPDGRDAAWDFRCRAAAENSMRGRMLATLDVMDWVNLYALAVNEENAAGGRVVTAPTNGAAGIVPAVLHYFTRFVSSASDDGVVDFVDRRGNRNFYKENASISGAEVGCQGRSASRVRWRRPGFVRCWVGRPSRWRTLPKSAWSTILVLRATRSAASYRFRASNEMRLPLSRPSMRLAWPPHGDGVHHVSLDKVIKTMRETGGDMKTSARRPLRGGLAVNIIEC